MRAPGFAPQVLIRVSQGAFFACCLSFMRTDVAGSRAVETGNGRTCVASTTHWCLETVSWYLREQALYQKVMSEWKLKQKS